MRQIFGNDALRRRVLRRAAYQGKRTCYQVDIDFRDLQRAYDITVDHESYCSMYRHSIYIDRVVQYFLNECHRGRFALTFDACSQSLGPTVTPTHYLNVVCHSPHGDMFEHAIVVQNDTGEEIAKAMIHIVESTGSRPNAFGCDRAASNIGGTKGVLNRLAEKFNYFFVHQYCATHSYKYVFFHSSIFKF